MLGFGKPDWFDQVGREVGYAHQSAALFDQSCFGKIRVRGRDAQNFLNRVCCNDMTRAPGCVIYSAMLNRRGGFESDPTALRFAEDDYRLYVGTSAIKRDLTWLQRQLQPDEQVELKDETDEYAVLALMGPKTAGIMTRLGAERINRLGYFRLCRTELAGIAIDAARLSYVGEAGWELTCPAARAGELYRVLTSAGAKPAGIFAQTSMRIEKRFLAFGQDLDTDLDPLQAGLDFTIDWDSEFIGKTALLALRRQKPRYRLVSILFSSPDAQPLGNEPVYHAGEIIGKTTSAAFGYRVGKPVAIALVNTRKASNLNGISVDVDIARSQNAGVILVNAAFDPDGYRIQPPVRYSYE